MELQEQFEQAVADSKNLSSKPDNQALLQLYSLYKQASIGDVNTDAPTNAFDFVAKAKYTAWDELKGTSTTDAMTEYVNLVNKLKG